MLYPTCFEQELEKIKASAPFIPGVIIVHDLNDLSVLYMSPNGLKTLGTTMEELKRMGPEWNDHFFNPEESRHYAPQIIEFIVKNQKDEFFTFFQQVKVAGSADWEWYMTSIKIFTRFENGEPATTIAMAFPINTKHLITSNISRLLTENNFIRKNMSLYQSLSKREKEIISLMVKGFSAHEIGDRLHLSSHTIDTHRRNIKKKLGLNSLFDLVEYARIFNIQ